LRSECMVEIYCTKADLADFHTQLEAWQERGTVTVNISTT
jgi:hypothetical protein